MTREAPKFDGPMDEWFNAGDRDRVLRTTDGFHVHMYREKNGWAARITDIELKKDRLSLEIYPSEADLKAKCIEVLADMRQRRAKLRNPQGTIL